MKGREISGTTVLRFHEGREVFVFSEKFKRKTSREGRDTWRSESSRGGEEGLQLGCRKEYTRKKLKKSKKRGSFRLGMKLSGRNHCHKKS